jgi:conjugal transfer pilus assembly protein TraE
MAVAGERLKRDGAATVFSPRTINVDEHALKVAVQGQLTTFISDRRVAEVSKSYLIELQYALGRITIKSFKETNANDPLDTQTGAAGAPAGN